MRTLGGSSFVALLAVTACEPQGQAPDWVSDNPWLGQHRGPAVVAKDDDVDVDDDDDAAREVLEADVVAIEGDRIYALSPYGGLGIVDASSPDELELLGRWRASAQPFELYVDEGRVLAMLTDHGAHVYDERTGTWQWRTSSRLVALDARDPARIAVLGEFVLPGWIQDSRRVGDVVYVVTQEDGGCWGCRAAADTTVTSIDVSDPARPIQRDQLVLESGGLGGPRSVMSTDARLYVAGPSPESWESGRSSIEVIDASDPSGELVRGASVVVAGAIQSRWQLDEHEGVLRVVSQPGFGGSGSQAPVIETFAIASSTQVRPLGRAALALPRPELLESVRFDGDRAYAITFERTDPLITIDLSEPDTPRQAGSLEIPGWVEHMEPRGGRLLALGFEPGHPDGSLTVSLFDVDDLDRPTLLSRARLGGAWPSLVEDPNRLHKAFTVRDELGLVLVPFAGWTEASGGCPGAWQSGIQLVDWSDDRLVRRGLAPSHGRARRALVHRGRMLGMSDVALESFDITDRDAPVRTDELRLAVPIDEVAIDGNRAVRLSHDWWTGAAALEVVATADADAIEPLGRVSLASLLGDACGGGWWGADLLAHAGHAYLVIDGDPATREPTRVAVFDVRDPAAPRWVTTLELPFARGWARFFPGELGTATERAVIVGDAMVLVRHESIREAPIASLRSSFEIIDLSRPEAPAHAGSVPRPDAMTHGDLAVMGDEVVSWHVQSASPDGSRLRYFFEHLDPRRPSAVVAPSPVGVPGLVASWDPRSRRLVAIDSRIETLALPEAECLAHARTTSWDAPTGTCRLIARPLSLLRVSGTRATLLHTLEIEGRARMLEARAGDDRLFAHLGRQPAWRPIPTPLALAADEVSVITGLRASVLHEAARTTLPPAAWSGVSLLEVAGRRLLLSLTAGLGELDAAAAAVPVLEVHPLHGFACLDLAVSDDVAYCAMGDHGLQIVPLGPPPSEATAVVVRWLAATLLLALGLLAVLALAARERRGERSR